MPRRAWRTDRGGSRRPAPARFRPAHRRFASGHVGDHASETTSTGARRSGRGPAPPSAAGRGRRRGRPRRRPSPRCAGRPDEEDGGGDRPAEHEADEAERGARAGDRSVASVRAPCEPAPRRRRASAEVEASSRMCLPHRRRALSQASGRQAALPRKGAPLGAAQPCRVPGRRPGRVRSPLPRCHPADDEK